MQEPEITDEEARRWFESLPAKTREDLQGTIHIHVANRSDNIARCSKVIDQGYNSDENPSLSWATGTLFGITHRMSTDLAEWKKRNAVYDLEFPPLTNK